MSKEVSYRSIRPRDIHPLARIIQDTWFSGETVNQNVPIYASRVLLYYYLMRHGFSKVAVKDGVPVGIIIGGEKNVSLLTKRFSLYAFFNLFKLCFSKEGRQSIKEFFKENAIDKQLLKNAGESFDSELILFVVGEEARGLGVGSSLFKHFKSYQISIQAKSYFLFTDDACTIEFYERKGLKRAAIYPDGDFNYYLYKGTQ